MEQDLTLMKQLRQCGHVLYHRRCLNQSQNRILVLLKNQGMMTQKDLMKAMHIQSGSLSEVLGKVEQAGYIQKKRCENDRRNYEVTLTDEGKAQADRFENHQMEMAERLFQRLSAQQKDELEALLGVLLLDWADFKSCRLCEEGREKDV